MDDNNAPSNREIWRLCQAMRRELDLLRPLPDRVLTLEQTVRAQAIELATYAKEHASLGARIALSEARAKAADAVADDALGRERGANATIQALREQLREHDIEPRA